MTPYAETYLRVSLFGIPSMLLVLAGTGVLRGLQDTRTPLFVSIGGFSANLLLNVVSYSSWTGGSPVRPGAPSSPRRAARSSTWPSC